MKFRIDCDYYSYVDIKTGKTEVTPTFTLRVKEKWWNLWKFAYKSTDFGEICDCMAYTIGIAPVTSDSLANTIISKVVKKYKGTDDYLKDLHTDDDVSINSV